MNSKFVSGKPLKLEEYADVYAPALIKNSKSPSARLLGNWISLEIISTESQVGPAKMTGSKSPF